ncbi:MAG: hypothetical protein AB1714_04580 [Acidobacteriota bacterium]
MRYLMIDRIEELKRHSYAVGTKCITLSDDCFEHHFPGQPIYPGALLIETMAQLGGALLEISLRDDMGYCPRCVLSTVKAKFREFAHPGDLLSIRAEVVSIHDDSAMVRGSVMRADETISEAEMIFVFLRVEDLRLESSRRELIELLTRKTKFVE